MLSHMTNKARLGRPIDLPSPWYEMAVAMGGVKNLAKALGTTPRSIQRYASLKTNPDMSLKKTFNELADALRTERPFPMDAELRRTGT